MRPRTLTYTSEEGGPAPQRQGERLPAVKGAGLHRTKWLSQRYLKASNDFSPGRGLLLKFVLAAYIHSPKL